MPTPRRAVLLATVLPALLWAGAAPGQSVHPLRRLESYPGALERPIEAKVRRAEGGMLDLLHQINLQYGQDRRPATPAPDHPLAGVVRGMLAELPPPVHRLASRYVVAVYLVTEDFGTGTTEAVQDDRGRWRYGWIALNLTALERTANAWASWKERSAFRPEAGTRIELTLEPPAGDTLAGAVRFIFLHELGHVLGLGLQAHGFWDAEGIPAATRDGAFPRISWVPGRPHGRPAMVSPWWERFPVLERLDFYSFAEAPLSAARAPEAYAALARTDLPSLYGATSVYEDFAETFAIHVHTALLGKPYRVVVRRGGRVAARYTSCLADGGCPAKARVLRRLLARDAAR